MLLVPRSLWVISSVKHRTFQVWGKGRGGGVGSSEESYFENVKWNQKRRFSKGELANSYFSGSLRGLREHCRTLERVLFSWGLPHTPLSFHILLLWELFLIKNCCKVCCKRTVWRRPGRGKYPLRSHSVQIPICPESMPISRSPLSMRKLWYRIKGKKKQYAFFYAFSWLFGLQKEINLNCMESRAINLILLHLST